MSVEINEIDKNLTRLIKPDFEASKETFRICDKCGSDMIFPRKTVEYVGKTKAEGGRFLYINIGLCGTCWGELPEEL